MTHSVIGPLPRRASATALTVVATAGVTAESTQPPAHSPNPTSTTLATTTVNESTLAFGRFGTVAVHAPAGPPRQVALFVSGDGGWNLGVVDMARSLDPRGVLVAGVEVTQHLRALEAAAKTCAYPATDFEAVSQYLQKRLGLLAHLTPVLVG